MKRSMKWISGFTVERWRFNSEKRKRIGIWVLRWEQLDEWAPYQMDQKESEVYCLWRSLLERHFISLSFSFLLLTVSGQWSWGKEEMGTNEEVHIMTRSTNYQVALHCSFYYCCYWWVVVGNINTTQIATRGMEWSTLVTLQDCGELCQQVISQFHHRHSDASPWLFGAKLQHPQPARPAWHLLSFVHKHQFQISEQFDIAVVLYELFTTTYHSQKPYCQWAHKQRKWANTIPYVFGRQWLSSEPLHLQTTAWSCLKNGIITSQPISSIAVFSSSQITTTQTILTTVEG